MIKTKKKNIYQTKKKEHNNNLKSEVRTHIKKVIKAIKEKNKIIANGEFILTTSKLDKLAKKKIIHKNTAARQKRNLNKKLKALNLTCQ
mgnify:CR=1 FL=1